MTTSEILAAGHGKLAGLMRTSRAKCSSHLARHIQKTFDLLLAQGAMLNGKYSALIFA